MKKDFDLILIWLIFVSIYKEEKRVEIAEKVMCEKIVENKGE